MARILLGFLTATILVGATVASPEREVARRVSHENTIQALRAELGRERARTRKAQQRVRREWVARMKERRAFKASLAMSPIGAHPYEVAFQCIHQHEGSWTDPNPPYWGGLQMDRSFYTSYGDWAAQAFGTPDRWPVSVQMAVAIRALVSGRGFYPWPNTARMCGLL